MFLKLLSFQNNSEIFGAALFWKMVRKQKPARKSEDFKYMNSPKL